MGRLTRSISRESLSSNSSARSSSTATGQARSIGAGCQIVTYSNRCKAARTVGIIVFGHLVASAPLVLSVTIEYWTRSAYFSAARLLVYTSCALNPLIYGFLNRKVRKTICMDIRSLLTGQVAAAPPRLERRWSISSHLLDFLPANNAASSAPRVISRRSSVDSAIDQRQAMRLQTLGRRGSNTSDENDPQSRRLYQMFRQSRSAQRRRSAPSRLPPSGAPSLPPRAE